jgi:hypothetical protein
LRLRFALRRDARESLFGASSCHERAGVGAEETQLRELTPLDDAICDREVLEPAAFALEFGKTV